MPGWPMRQRSSLYVDSVNGDNSGSGTPSSPLRRLDYAVAAMSSMGGGTIYVSAPESDPLPHSVLVDTTYPITLTSWGTATWFAQTNSAVFLTIEGSGSVTVERGHLVGADYGVRIGKAAGVFGEAGRVAAIDTHAEGGTSGWQTYETWTTLDCTRCTGLGITNDGFNIHGATGIAGVATLTDCTATECGDEGASPHDDTILHIIGGTYSNNIAGGGVTAVNNAVMHISGGAVFAGNLTGGAKTNQGGISFFDATCSGSIDGASATDNTGPGVYVAPGAAVTVANLTSSGNTVADTLP